VKIKNYFITEENLIFKDEIMINEPYPFFMLFNTLFSISVSLFILYLIRITPKYKLSINYNKFIDNLFRIISPFLPLIIPMVYWFIYAGYVIMEWTK